MNYTIFQVDAFTTKLFKGNPAAVVLLGGDYPKDEVLLSIAAENNLSETAFLCAREDSYQLRWFTPAVEVPLCGHATLASAAVLMQRVHPGMRKVRFQTLSGPLDVEYDGRYYVLDFPVRSIEPDAVTDDFEQALGVRPQEVWRNEFTYLCVLKSETEVHTLQPNMERLKRLDRAGCIVTAVASKNYDFISRYFAPAKGVDEDPVTGSAHCSLVSYWAPILHKTSFRAFQASARGGELLCELHGDRVRLYGECTFYLEGVITVPDVHA